MYTHAVGQAPIKDNSGAPRIALHSSSLRLIHPITQKELAFESLLPRDLASFCVLSPGTNSAERIAAFVAAVPFIAAACA